MPTNVAGKYIDEPQFKPFWDALAAGGKPLFIHPANAPCQSNWDKYSLHQKILWPTDSTLAISRIVYAGIFDHYPNLKMIASHLGGMILLYLDRLNWREGKPVCREEPESYFKKIYYDTAGPIRAAFIKLVYDTVGADQILFGADYPHGRGGKRRPILSDDPKGDERARHPEGGQRKDLLSERQGAVWIRRGITPSDLGNRQSILPGRLWRNLPCAHRYANLPWPLPSTVPRALFQRGGNIVCTVENYPLCKRGMKGGFSKHFNCNRSR